MSLASRLTALAQAIAADVKAIYAVLGPNPQGTAATVAARIAAVEASKSAAFCRATTASQNITDAANGGAYTALALTADDANNTAGMHAANSSRIVAPVAGPYALSAAVWANTFITAGRVSASLRVNGNEVALEQDNLTSQAGRALVVSTSMWLNVGDYVEVFVEISNTAANPVNVKGSLSVGLQGGSKGDKGDPGIPANQTGHGVTVHKTATVIPVPNAIWTALSGDTITADNADGQWSAAAPDRLTCKKSGWYQVWGQIIWPTAAAGTGRRIMALSVNGVTESNAGATRYPGGNDLHHSESWPVYLNQGDYVQVHLYQDSGATINVPSTFTAWSCSFGMAPLMGPKGDPGPAVNWPVPIAIGSADCPFSNGWRKYTNAGFLVPNPFIEIGLDGWVRLQAMLDKNGGNWVANEVMFTLPVAARPANIVMLPAWVAGSSQQYGRVDVHPDGTVQLYAGAAQNPVGYLAMMGAMWKAGW